MADGKVATTGNSLGNDLTVLSTLLPKLFGSKTYTSYDPTVQTQQTQLSQEAVNALLTEKLSSVHGLAATARGQRQAGLYNSVTNQLLINDLLARSAAEVEKARAPTVTTKTGGTQTQRTPGMIDGVNPILLLAGSALLNKDVRKKGSDILDSVFKESVDTQTALFGPSMGIDTSAGTYGVQINPIESFGSPELLSTGSDTAAFAMDQIGALGGGYDLLSGYSGVESAIDFVGPSADLAGGAADAAGMGFDLGGTPLSPIIRLASGDVEGAAGSAAGFVIGNAILPGIGGAIGGLIGGGGSMICTELYRQGLMSREMYLVDSLFGASLSTEIVTGYQKLATPVVSLMRRSRIFTRLINLFAAPWAEHMAYSMGAAKKDNHFGRLIMNLGKPLCATVGARILEKRYGYSV